VAKDEQDWSALVVQAPPLYIQEKVHPKALIDDQLRQSRRRRREAGEETPDLFADFNAIPQGVDRTEFYQHDQNWSNRMILGDSLQVMAGLAEREGLRGKVQCIYIDPPYGIKFNSNFRWSTTSPDVKDGNAAHITREPEQVKAFRDTWRDGIHSYLTYLRDRLTVARDLLVGSGALFVLQHLDRDAPRITGGARPPQHPLKARRAPERIRRPSVFWSYLARPPSSRRLISASRLIRPEAHVH
jgi:adenine-specific DNA-methyltransferase